MECFSQVVAVVLNIVKLRDFCGCVASKENKNDRAALQGPGKDEGEIQKQPTLSRWGKLGTGLLYGALNVVAGCCHVLRWEL